jgi:hypothetical protein
MRTQQPKKTATKKNSAPPRSRSAAQLAAELDGDELDDLDELDDGSVAEAAAADLDAVFAELGGNSNATITVTRVGQNGREERCARYMASELIGNFEVIREQWGAGTYWLYGHDGKTLARKRPITFARSIEEQREIAPRPSSSTSSPASAVGVDAFTAALDRLAALQRDQFQQLLTIVNARPQGAGLAEVVTLAEKMASIGGGSRGDVDTLLRGVELARKFGGGGDEVSIGGALAEFVRMLREPAGALPAIAAPGAPGATTAGGGEGGMLQEAMIRRALAQQLPALLRGAQAGTDAGVYAQLILDQVPELYAAPLVEFLKRPDWFDVLAAVDGRAVPYRDWFVALGSEIVRATSPEGGATP